MSTNNSNRPTTVIVGAGLCGLALAYRLQQADITATVLEANSDTGGRIKPAGSATGHQDLGPTWVWPYAQPVVKRWVEELGLELFDQFDSGKGLLDRSANEPAVQQFLPSQHGSARIKGGTHAFIRKLESHLPGQVQLNTAVTGCTEQKGKWLLNVSSPSNTKQPTQVIADRLIIATPPRLAAAMFETENESVTDVLSIMRRSETWMAPHAKVVAFYETAFWRDAGLSGRIASQAGPLVEVHDHCGPEGTPAALFGFSGVPANIRSDNSDYLVAAIKQQLRRCFGAKAPEPIDIVIKDWAFEPFTTTEADRNGNGAHPPVLDNRIRQSYCNNSLWFAGSETAAISAGLIEGALARADEIAQNLVQLNH